MLKLSCINYMQPNSFRETDHFVWVINTIASYYLLHRLCLAAHHHVPNGVNDVIYASVDVSTFIAADENIS
jgi:hypothetical protein